MLSQRFDEALLFAAELHRRQRRKGVDVPYLSHLLAVAAIVLEHGGSEEQAIAALLHDAVEDQGGPETGERIAERFGESVARIVWSCTDSVGEPKPPWRARKEAFIAQVRLAPEEVRLVAAADKLHNARAILGDYRLHGEALWQRFSGGRAGTLWYYGALREAFLETGPEAIAEELARVVTELERLASVGDPGE